MVDSMSRFFSLPPGVRSQADAFLTNLRRLFPDAGKPSTPVGLVYRRNRAIRGSLDAFGYDYLADHLGRDAAGKLVIHAFEGLRGNGEDYIYEALNLADGSRTTSDIRDALSAIYGPVPQEVVDAFLAGAAKAGLLEQALSVRAINYSDLTSCAGYPRMPPQ